MLQDTGNLVKSLELPTDVSGSGIGGIYQPDIIVRTALIAGLADLRANPYLLDYAFASMAQDDLLAQDPGYSDEQIKLAKDWFLNTKVPVRMVTQLTEPVFPCVTVEDQESNEEENTLGDINYEPSEETRSFQNLLAGPFAASKYTPATGELVIPLTVAEQIILSTALIVIDSTGAKFPVIAVKDALTLVIAPNSLGDFSNARIVGREPSVKVSIESAGFRTSYMIGCYVQGEPVQLYYLSSIIQFVLLRYREALLEGRGFERSRIQVMRAQVDSAYEDAKQYVFSRPIALTGFVRNYWPKLIAPKVTATTMALSASGDPMQPFSIENSSVG